MEFGGLWAFENDLRQDNINTGFWEIGAMKNRADGRTALGASLYASYDDTEYRNMLWAVKARGRYRLTRHLKLDVGAGPIFAVRDLDEWVDVRLPGATFRATLNVHDWVGVTAGFDAYRMRVSRELPPVARNRYLDEQWSWFVGAQANGYLGVLGGVAGAAMLVIVNKIRD